MKPNYKNKQVIVKKPKKTNFNEKKNQIKIAKKKKNSCYLKQ